MRTQYTPVAGRAQELCPHVCHDLSARDLCLAAAACGTARTVCPLIVSALQLRPWLDAGSRRRRRPRLRRQHAREQPKQCAPH